MVVVADSPAPDVVEALRNAGAFPVVEANWADAAAAVASVKPEAVVLADAVRRWRTASRMRRSADRLKAGAGPFTPMIARTREDAPRRCRTRCRLPRTRRRPDRAPAHRGAARPHAARHSDAPHPHAGLARRAAAGIAATIRSRTRPCWSPAAAAPIRRCRSRVGEHVGLVGALSVESAARALNARDIDGMVIGDGFGPRIVEALLTVLAEDVRFRDLPVAVLGGHPAMVESFAANLPNLDRISEGPARLVERFLPFVRLHAFGQRLKRMLKSLDAKGMIDPDTGLLAHDAFWRDLNRAVDDAEKRGVGLSIARFSFARSDRRTSLDAARLVSRLMRKSTSPAARPTIRSSRCSPRPICARPMSSRAASPACSSTRCWRPTASTPASTRR